MDGGRSGFSETGIEGYLWTSILRAFGRWWINSTSAILSLMMVPWEIHMWGKSINFFLQQLLFSFGLGDESLVDF